jgi:hypothetical protein
MNCPAWHFARNSQLRDPNLYQPHNQFQGIGSMYSDQMHCPVQPKVDKIQPHDSNLSQRQNHSQGNSRMNPRRMTCPVLQTGANTPHHPRNPRVTTAPTGLLSE